MKYRVFKTGIGFLDKMLGGGLIEGGSLLVVYNTGSHGWVLGVEVFKQFLLRGWYGVVTNYSLPYSLLKKYALSVRFPIESFGMEGKLAIVDVFGSVNDIRTDDPFVYSLGTVDGTTFLPKMVALYSTLIKDKPQRIGISVTMDGFVEVFGEETGIRILKKNMAIKERYSSANGAINVLLINRDRVSGRFLSWLSQYSEHIVEFRPTQRPGVETLYVIKSLLPDFEPSTGVFRFKKGTIEILPTSQG